MRSPALYVTPSSMAWCKSEPARSGGLYTITVTAQDNAGNQTSASPTVAVPTTELGSTPQYARSECWHRRAEMRRVAGCRYAGSSAGVLRAWLHRARESVSRREKATSTRTDLKLVFPPVVRDSTVAHASRVLALQPFILNPQFGTRSYSNDELRFL